MSQLLDEWLYGSDTGKTITWTVTTPDGSTPDYTAASAIVLTASCPRPQRSFTLAGSVLDGPNRKFSFLSPTTAAPDPGAGNRDVYEFRITFTLSGQTYSGGYGRLSIVRFP